MWRILLQYIVSCTHMLKTNFQLAQPKTNTCAFASYTEQVLGAVSSSVRSRYDSLCPSVITIN